MFSKLRYGMVILAGAALVALAFGITKTAVTKKKIPETEVNEQQSFDASESADGTETADEQSDTIEVVSPNHAMLTAGSETAPEDPETAESASDDGGLQDITAAEAASDGSEEAEETTSGVTDIETIPGSDDESSEASEVFPEESADDASEAVSEESAEEPAAVGLVSWFKDKLIINEDKVKLYLNIREEPDEDSEILDVLYPDETADIVRRVGAWYEVQRDGFTGFVKASYVLTDEDAYEVLKHTVSFGAVIMQNETILYESTDSSQPGIQLANKGDVFRVVGMADGFFRVLVYSEVYESLYVRADQVFLYYLFLGPGNSNELDEATEAYLDSLDLSGNLERAYAVQAEALQEQAAYEEAVQAYRAEKQKQEQQWNAEQIAAAQAAQAAQAAAEQAAAQAAAAPADNGGLEYLGTFMITNYCHCPLCCGAYGSWDPNYQAYGSANMPLIPDYSVAVDIGQIPYGTRLMINGREYMAADTGVPAGVIDIYHQTHEAALAGGMCYADVYVIH